MTIRGYISLILLCCTAAMQLSCKPDDAPQPVKEPAKLYFYSVTAAPTHNESITLKNNSGATLDLSEWTIGDKNDPTAYNIPSNTIVEHGAFITFPHTTLGFQINDAGEILYLKQGAVVVDTWGN